MLQAEKVQRELSNKLTGWTGWTGWPRATQLIGMTGWSVARSVGRHAALHIQLIDRTGMA